MLQRRISIAGQKVRSSRLETGFSMLEAVVVVGVLLALAVGGFLSYGPITDNAKNASVRSAASSVYTAVMAAAFDGDSSTNPDDVVRDYNASTTKIKVEILDTANLAAMTTAESKPNANGDFCIEATSLEKTSIKARMGSCDGATSPAPGGDTVTPGNPAPALPAVSTARLKFGVAEANGPLSTQVDDVARLVDEYPGYVMMYKDFTQSFPTAEVKAVDDKGSQAIVTWEPFNSAAVNPADPANQPDYQLKDIMDGNHDAEIDSWINAIKTTNYSKPILIRFAHEMNGNWYPWAQQANGNSDWEYVNAWKHVHDKFTAAGVQDKVDWLWSPNVPYDGGLYYGLLYPGDSYVDYIGIDGFNYGTTESWSSWQEPWVVLGGGIDVAKGIAPTKPVIIAETGSVPSSGGNSQADWVTHLVSWLNEPQNSHVTGFVWFDQMKGDQLETGGGTKDWRLSTSSETSNAMKAALAARR
jgi:beta-mannanase/type II secretory pathway pseudopilin PulG